jgi:Protein of unknown function (DUF3703)
MAHCLEKRMKATVHKYLKTELSNAKIAIAEQDFQTAWTALEHAHILGQTDAIMHTVVHYQMLKLAWKQRDVDEIAGQLFPVLLALPLTFIFGQMRSLRSGKAHLNGSEKMSIPPDIQKILNQPD